MVSGIVLSPFWGVMLIIVGLPVVFCLVALILRYSTCWNRLERLYLDQDASFLQVIGFPVLKIISPFDPWGFFNTFRHVIQVGLTEKGLLFKAIFPLGFIFRPIQIPWDELLIADQEYIGNDRQEIILTNLPDIEILLPPITTSQIKRALLDRDSFYRNLEQADRASLIP